MTSAAIHSGRVQQSGVTIRRSNAPPILLIAATGIVTASVSLLTLNRVKDAAIAATMAGRPIVVSTLLQPLGVSDVLLMLLAAAMVAAMAVWEVRSRAFSRLLATATDTEALACLLVLTCWCGHPYLNPGVLLGGDTATHISRFHEISEGLRAGRLAQWTNYQYGGAPLLWFTGPLTYVVGGVLAFAIGDAMLAAKLLLFTLHVATAWLFFAWLRRLGVRPVPAMLAAAGFACAFARLHLYLYRGVIPQAFTSLFLVLLFLAADGLLRAQRRRWPDAVWFAVATAGLIANHQPHALFAALYLAVFGLGAVATGAWRTERAPLLLLAGLLGVIAATIVVLPTIAEAQWVMIEPQGAMIAWRSPTWTRLLNLVLWRDTRTTWGTDYWAYLGFGLIIGAAGALVSLLTRRLPEQRVQIAVPAAACLALSLFIWSPAVRDIQYMLLFAGILAAFGFDAMLDAPWLRGRRRLCAVVVILVDLASTSVQPVARTDKQFLSDAGRLLARTDPDQRVVEMQVSRRGALQVDLGPDGGPISYQAMVQRVAGNHNMAATRLHNPALVALHEAQTDLQDYGRLSPNTTAMLALLNVGHVICEQPQAMGCPAALQDMTDDPVLGRHLRLADAAPALYSRTLTTVPAAIDLEKPMIWPDDFGNPAEQPRIDAITAEWTHLLAVEQPDFTRRTARTIGVQDLVVVAPPPDQAPADFAVQSYHVDLTTVRLVVRASAAGFVQLTHPWLPSTDARVNGVAVAKLHGTLGLLVLPVPSGISTIVLQEGQTPIRRDAERASLCGVLGILLLAIVEWMRARRVSHAPAM